MTHNGLAIGDRLKLGVVKVWGAGSTKITEVTLTVAGVAHNLTPEHNVESQVSAFVGCSFLLSYTSKHCRFLYLNVNN